MNYTPTQIANALDLAVLKPTASADDIKSACALAYKHQIKSVCVAPCHVRLANHCFDNVSCVIGFPHGNSTPYAKCLEAREAINNGAKELDVVVNFGCFLSGNTQPMKDDLHRIISFAHQRGILVKAILETCYYTKQQLLDACNICINANVDFIKTSTGFAPSGADTYAVQTILDAVQGKCQVKASGGIKTYADACKYLNMGVTRIGAGDYFANLSLTNHNSWGILNICTN